MTGSAFAVQDHHEPKVSEERLVGIKYCSVFNGVELPMQASQRSLY